MSTDDLEPYLAVLKAAYDYEPQSEDEISIKEDELLFLIERTDDDWWKVKPKGGSPDEETTAGLVPAAYVEQAPHTLVKALYDYDPQSSGELKIQEDQILYSFRVPGDDDWLLVQYHDKEDHHEGARAGYVPTNYVEDTSENPSPSSPPPAAASPAIVVPDSDMTPGPAPRGQPYTDPADLVAASHHTRSASLAVKDPIQTWGIAEVDKKGKKKKGTLGVGNGSLFFASESDKTPVQKYDTGIITNTRIDKSKHVFVTLPVDGEDLELHFNAGSKDTAEAIIAKIESSRVLSQVDALVSGPTAGANGGIERSPAKKGVHFAETGPAIIPPRDPSPDGDDDDAEPAGLGLHADGAQEGAILHAGEGAVDRVDEEVVGGAEEAVVMYEFDAQGEDELSVREEERVWVIEKDAEGDWWKCRNEAGKEGVIPASYVEPTGRSSAPPASTSASVSSVAEGDDSDARETEERAEREQAKARKQREQERAKVAAASAEAEQKRKLREKERQREREREERERATEQEAKERKENREKERKEQEKKEQAGRPSSSSGSGRQSTERRGPPPADKVRTWHDRTGQFRVDAAFLAYKDGKIRLHKVNGVVIEVPSEKMSMEDMQYIHQAMSQKPSNGSPTLVNGSRTSDDDEPLAVRRNSLRVQPKSSETKARELQQKKKKGPTIDWFEFFLNAGCDLDDCTRYSTSFERDKIEEELLPDITESTMRSLGLREGDIIRVNKEIQKRFPGAKKDKDESQKDLLGVDGVETPRRTTPSPAPNLFSGPGGALKTARRGRPQPSKSLPPSSVDINAISTASDQIQRSVTPASQAASPGAVSSPVQVPSRSNSTAPSGTGFDDDAWTVRPSSTKPTAPTPPAAPAVAATPPIAPPAPTPPPAAPVQAQPTGLARTTEADVFNQLARLSELRMQSPPSVSPSPAFAGPNRMGPSPGITSPPPASYGAGLGMGSSPSPMGQHLQAQQTGILPPPSPANGPRGPYAPVPANQALLQPLIPTSTGFNGFVPTRPATAPLQQQQFLGPQPTGFLPSLAPQPTGFQPSFNSQPTGFQPSFAPQQTGFQPSGQFMPPQQTGMPGGYGSSFGGGPAPPVPPLPSFQNNNSFGQIQPTPTGFNPGFGQFGNGMSPPPPQQPSKDTTPANIFASMKAGTFANESAPQSSDKYDALRANPAPLTAQPTGWGGFPGGYPGYQL